MPRNFTDRRTLFNMPCAIVVRPRLLRTQAKTHHNETSNVRVTNVQTSQQTPVAVVEQAQGSTPLFSLEIEEHVFQGLSDLASINGIPIKVLVSRLLMHMIVYHPKEIEELVERIKCPAAW